MLALISFHSLSFLSFFPCPCKFKVCSSQPKAHLIPLTSGKERMVRVPGLSGLCSWSYRASTQGVAPGKRKHDFAKFSFPSLQCSQYWSMPTHSPPTPTPLLSHPLSSPPTPSLSCFLPVKFPVYVCKKNPKSFVYYRTHSF